jgi:hypothetical protein
VTVRLPRAPSAIGQSAATSDPIQHDHGAQIRVLVVEDDPATRDLLASNGLATRTVGGFQDHVAILAAAVLMATVEGSLAHSQGQ